MFIKEYREMRGLTQQQLADKIEVQRNSISRYENGGREPDPATLIKLAKALNTTVDSLLVGEEETTSGRQKKEDVGVLLDRTLDMLKDEGSVQFNGRMLDSDAKQLLLDSLQSNIRLTDELSKRAKGNDEKG